MKRLNPENIDRQDNEILLAVLSGTGHSINHQNNKFTDR
jgi:hypothetical protein